MLSVRTDVMAEAKTEPEAKPRLEARSDGSAADRPPVDPRWPVRIRGLHKSFRSQEVLRGVNLDVERAKINVIIGASGQGKTVLIKLVMGLIRPDAGQIW